MEVILICFIYTVKLGDKEQIGVKELFTDYQPFCTINQRVQLSWNYYNIVQDFCFDDGLYQLRTEVPSKIQRSIWELILMHLPSTKMLAQYLVEVLSTALNSLVAGLTSLKIWSAKSAKKRHLCASISAHSLHKMKHFLNSLNFAQNQ